MNFIAAKAAVVKLLEDNANGQFRVVSYEPLPAQAKDFTGTDRTVRVFYSGGRFDNDSLSTPTMHNIEMTLEMVATASSHTDLGVIDDPASSDSQRAAALVGTQPAALLVDESWDEFASLLWNILMTPENRWLGMSKYIIGNRRIEEIKKDRLVPVGKMCILTGFISLSFNIKEVSTGVRAVPFAGSTTEFTPINGDTVQKTVQTT